MPLPLNDLDDRRFDDLVSEARARLARHLPELTQVSPGDPVHALVDLFAWLTETILYRANQIPERQRRAFLNLLQLPLRPARPARGVVCIDADPRVALPQLLAAESRLQAGDTTFTTAGEVQPTPLELKLLVKERIAPEDLASFGVTLHQLREQYGVEPATFRPRSLTPGRDPVDLGATLDGAAYLGLCAPAKLATKSEALTAHLAGITLNLGLAPADAEPAEQQTRVPPRRLSWDLAWWPAAQGPSAPPRWLPLAVVVDTSLGGRQPGAARLRLPRDPGLLRAPQGVDPRLAGLGDGPPEPPADLKPGQLLFWLRLTCPEEPGLRLGYLGVNGVEVVGHGVVRDAMLGVGDGRPDQVLALPQQDLDEASLELEVEEEGRWAPWTRVEQLAASGPEARVYRVDAASGSVRFGDGLRGRRPASGARIRAAAFRYGGGSRTNLAAGAIRELHGGSARLRVRHEWPTGGGVDAETLDAAERRIPAFLTHRERAVTREDYALLARDNPVNPVARADAVPGFLPGASLTAVRRGVPGVVSVFVLPPAAPAVGAAPRCSAGLLRDVYGYLSARTLLGSEVYVLCPQFQPVALALSLEVVDPASERQVFAEVEQALLQFLWALPPGGPGTPAGGGWPLGRAVEVNELRTQAGRVAGVQAVNEVRLFYRDLEAGVWHELTETQALPLADYQLPELAEVRLEAGEGMPEAPRAVTAAADAGAAGGVAPVPVPVIPDVC